MFVTAQQGPPSFQCLTYIICQLAIKLIPYVPTVIWTHCCSDVIFHSFPETHHTLATPATLAFQYSRHPPSLESLLLLLSLGVQNVLLPDINIVGSSCGSLLKSQLFCETFHSHPTTNPLNHHFVTHFIHSFGQCDTFKLALCTFNMTPLILESFFVSGTKKMFQAYVMPLLFFPILKLIFLQKV